MPRKATARVEGAEKLKIRLPQRAAPVVVELEEPVVPLTEEEASIAEGATAFAEAFNRLAEPPAERRLPNPVPGDDGEALERITASFRERFPDDWEKLALCPLKHGLIDMARLMKGKG